MYHKPSLFPPQILSVNTIVDDSVVIGGGSILCIVLALSVTGVPVTRVLAHHHHLSQPFVRPVTYPGLKKPLSILIM